MEHAKIVIFEDRPNLSEILHELFKDKEHEVVGAADTVAGSLSLVDRLVEEEVNPDVIVLDGNLDGGHGITCEDARVIFDRIKQSGLPGYVVGFSTELLLDKGIPVDMDSGKDPFEILQFIEDL